MYGRCEYMTDLQYEVKSQKQLHEKDRKGKRLHQVLCPAKNAYWIGGISVQGTE
jgi:hypothetical protein